MKNNKKKIFIIVGIVAAVAILAAIVAIVIHIKSGNKEENIVISLDEDSIVKSENFGIEDESIEIDIENADYFTKKDDFDGDGLNNIDEHDAGTDMYKIDTDGDGLNDYLEVRTYDTDPLKYSSRDDGISDLDWVIKDDSDFTEGYVEDEMSDFWVYLSKPEDRTFDLDVVDMEEFDSLDTISSLFKVERFSGKMAYYQPDYVSDIYKHMTVYAYRNDALIELDVKAYETKLEFEVEEGDVFALVYMENKSKVLLTGKETVNANGELSLVFEAENQTIVGSAVTSGHCVGNVGNGGDIHFDKVESENGGNYTLNIAYYAAEDRQICVKVNGGEAVTLDCVSNGSWDENAGTVSLDITLNAGTNTIWLFNDNEYAPNIDHIELIEK